MKAEPTSPASPEPSPPAASVGGLWPLAEAKLAAPRQRSGLVDRPRILEVLDAGADTALTLVAAPPGFGKSTAVRAWCAGRTASPAWVTLDARDNDPLRLWTYIATAVDRVRPGVGSRTLGELSVTADVNGPLDLLLNRIAGLGSELVIVLDDLQTVTDREALASIDYAVERLPANARVIVITRIDPALGLARLRAGGRLTELRADDLAFTVDEARELLVERGRLAVGDDEIRLLHARTEGWPAALALATLWLRRVPDLPAAVREFGGDQRFVADYLLSEVIGSLDADIRPFVLRVAVLGRFTAELCDGVLDRSDSASLLDELERSDPFMVRIECGGWYRVHLLLAQLAELHLNVHEPGAVADTHRRAAHWLRAKGLPVEAADHAVAAGDHELLAELLVVHHLALIRTGGARTLLRWVGTLPPDVVVARPEIAVSAATAATMVGHAVERRRLLHLADRAEAEHPERCTAYVRAVAGMVRAAAVDTNVADAVRAGSRAVAIAETGADAALVAALSGYARALYLAGDADAAWAAALRAVEHPDAPRRVPGHAFARSTLALVAAEQGRVELARDHAAVARSLVGAVGSSRSWLGANASAATGLVHACEGDLGEAERELSLAEHFFRDEVTTVHQAWLLLQLARVRCRRGRLGDAQATLESARAAIRELADGGWVPSLAGDVGRELEEAQSRAAVGELLDPPSPAELAVLRMLDTDLSVRQIGDELFLSANTVRTHKRSLYRKLSVGSRADAVARAGALGLIGDRVHPCESGDPMPTEGADLRRSAHEPPFVPADDRR
jgi:LuxR family transcriptional regulator, maltose regulon positive regulatory protein